MLQGVLWMLLPAVVYGILAWAVLDDPPRSWVRACTLGRRLRHRPAEAAAPRDEQAPALTPADPFEVLTVQVQLGRLAAQVAALEADPHAWARGRRLLATQAAYDALLAEACRLAGVPVERVETPEPWVPVHEPERFREEMELASRGWSW